MDFKHSEEQLLLQKTARDFLKTECSSDFVRRMEQDERGYTQELWAKMADLGWLGLMLPEEYGGINWKLLDLIVIAEEIGVVCLPGPFLSTTLSALAILEAGDASQKIEILPRVAAGEALLSLAYLEPGSTKYEPRFVTTTAIKEGGGFVLNGTKLFVADAQFADYIIISARSKGYQLDKNGISLFLVPTKQVGLTIAPLQTVAGDKQCIVNLEQLRVPPLSMLGPRDQGWAVLDRVLQIGAVAKCAEMVGGASKVLDMTVAYAKERVQFGKPIGSFQAVQHHLANMAIDLSGSRYITYKSAWAIDEKRTSELLVAAAKVWVNQAYRRIAALGHQIGAATAYCVDHDMPLYSRRAKAAEIAFGDTTYHRMRAAEALGI